MPSFFGTSSPKIIVAIVASTRPSVTEMLGTAPSGTPTAVSGPSISDAIAGSARNPMIRLVRVTPIWAPESWVDRDLSARRTPSACRSPSPAAFSTAARSTATRAYSAAPKTPHASTRPTEIPSSSHSMLTIVAGRSPSDVRPATRAGGRLSARAGTVGGSKYL